MNSEAAGNSGFLRPLWSRIPWTDISVPPWLFSLLVLAVLPVARYYAVFGPPQARILFLLHALVMWALPFLFLTASGRGQIGLRKPANATSALVLSVLAGAVCGLAFFAIGMALYGNSPDNWNVSIRDSLQLKQMLAVMPPAAAFAAIILPAMILTPIGEEILFRGLIQQSFTLRWNAVIATLVNGLAFGLIHLHVHGLWRDATGFQLRPISGALMVLLGVGLSAVFTLCRLRSGSLWCAMAAHAACNLAMIGTVFFYYI
ncbi:MAG: type II CAAX endopeptidase family protein [Terracidiphilus sp.]|jgi:membrane protease YdiL (CAAX protease family)